MTHARAWLAAALILLADCGGSKKKPAIDAGPEGGAAGRTGAAGKTGASGTDAGDAAGQAAGAAPGVDSGVDAGGATGGDAAIESLADGPGAETAGDAGVEAPPPAPGSPLRALAVSTGLLHTCALLDNHRIKCWGANGYGELGLGDKRDRGAAAADMGDNLPFVDLGTGRTAIAVSAGRYHTCAILDDGSVKCWGLPAFVGLPVNQAVGAWGDEPGEMGDHLPTLALGPGGHKAKLLASSFTASCAALDDQSIWCWSEDAPFIPKIAALDAHADVVQLTPWHYGVLALFADHTISATLPINSVAPSAPHNAVYVAGAEMAGCAVLDDGTAACGLVPYSPGGMPATGLLALGFIGYGSGSCGLFGGGAVRCWGACGEGPADENVLCGPEQADRSRPVMLGQPALALTTAGFAHMCAVLANGAIRCWSLDVACSGAPCEVPAQEAQDPNLGSSVEVVTTNNVRHYGAWHDIDLGKHP